MLVHHRPERPEDADAIDRVHRLAFDGEDEARLVRRLRESPGYDPGLSFVAHDGDRILGHVLFSAMHIETAGGDVPALALAPLAVLPEHQRTGVGLRLAAHGIDTCIRTGYRLVFVVGDPEYYAPLGFRSSRDAGVDGPYPDPYLQMLALGRPAPEGIRGGTARYPPLFNGV